VGIDAEMFVRTHLKFTEESVRELSCDLCEAFGHNNFLIWTQGEPEDQHHALSICKLWQQDGPDIKPKSGETFIRVHFYCRYYGKTYERGDLPLIISVADWLEHRVTDGKVWYGGDSSGVCAKPFGKKERAALFDHFCSVGHKPYEGFFDRSAEDDAMRPTCNFCRVPRRRYMWSGAKGAGYICDACGDKIVTRDGGKTWEKDERRD
jgi:hypothetical protein